LCASRRQTLERSRYGGRPTGAARLWRGPGVGARNAARRAKHRRHPAYMAPEQVFGEDITAAADWYSVGVVVLYEALTGRLPFDGSPALLLQMKQSALPPPPGSLVRDLPDDLAQLCLELL